ncbi:porin [Ralstonia pseudosolanacearum]|uniref:porin n=1 Tax=Ralstonia pseudosolanacearum TaxID=1310165 RepID=UPI0018D05EA0|nr:porin [Ralstonia pseudosolanacearum]
MTYIITRCIAPAVIAAALALPAHAQSSVTLYGRVVGGIEYIDKVAVPATGKTGSLLQAAGNQWGTSMFGMKGSESLGGGLQALFTLESGFSLPNSALNGPGLFNRRSYVGLSSPSWGTLIVGKNLSISNDIWDIDPTGQQFMSTATLVKGRNWPGADNMIEYRSPDLGGFSFGAQASLGEQPAGRRVSAQGLSATYQTSDLMLRGIYTERRDSAGAFSDVYNASKDGILGGTYRIGPAKLFAGYERILASQTGAGTAPSALSQAWLGVRYDLTQAATLIGTVYHVKSNQSGGNATLAMLGVDYYLSKRTFLYASLGGVSNGTNADYAADVTAAGPGVGKSQRVVYVGMGHSF